MKSTMRLLIVALVVASAVPQASAAEDDQRDEKGAPVVTARAGATASLADGARLKVLVVDAETLEPLRYFRLLLAWPEGGYQITHANSNGIASLSDVVQSSVRVMAGPQAGYRNEWYDEGDDYYSATRVRLDPGKRTTVTMALDKGSAHIAGEVTDASTGLPASGSEVTVYGFVAACPDGPASPATARSETDHADR